ncbi:MAG TPA: ATP-binding protein [Rhizomicrobium sp.]|nr:ATP-binding protein [Rhizomicrobium sp.]
MTGAESAPGSPGPRWADARRRVARLETSAAAMSSGWFLGMAGLVSAAVLFLATAVILAVCLVRLDGHFARVEKSESVVAELLQFQGDLDEGAAAGRGFAETHDPALLSTVKTARAANQRRLTGLAASLQEDPAAERMLESTAAHFREQVRLFDEMIAMSRNPAMAARVEEGARERIRMARHISGHLEQLRSYENGIITSQQDFVHLDIRFAIALVLFTGVVAPACGLAGIYLLRRERDSQKARELQMELMHAQRLGIMGQTAAMLAHEVNQPLTAATNFLAVLRRSLDNAPDKAPAILDKIGQQIQRAAGILRKLRAFIEKRETERSPEAPDVLIDDAVSLLGTIDNTVVLTTDVAENLPAVLVDRVQLQQVLVNLMRNAIEAMQTSPRRELSISVSAPDTRTVEFRLADTGPGLPPEVMEHLFQPFVSTKPNGMGVGLSICRTIIAHHQGSIWAEPNPGGGTVFRFTLPAMEERAAA